MGAKQMVSVAGEANRKHVLWGKTQQIFKKMFKADREGNEVKNYKTDGQRRECEGGKQSSGMIKKKKV